MSVRQLYGTVSGALRQLRPDERVTRLRACSWMMVGMFQSRSVHLSKIADKIPGDAKTLSKARRLRRFLDNSAVRVRPWYAPLARRLLAEAAAAHGEVRLVVDASKVGFGHQLLMVAIAYRRRALPIAWTWIKGARGHSTSYKQEALLAYVQQLLPPDTRVLLVGDSEFGAVPLLQRLDAWGWYYIVRRKPDHLVRSSPHEPWCPFGSLVTRPGQRAWHMHARLTRLHAHHVHLYACWNSGEEDPWLLVTNLSTAREAHQAYARRMWLEEMFGDFKGHGFDLESTHLRNFQRLSRLTLLVVLLYLWLIARGSQAIKAGHRHLVDRRERRDLSVFRIGTSIIERYLVNQRRFSIRWIPYFTQSVR
jgi:hypothetical protein